MSGLTHFDAQGQAHMVDVAGKASTHRKAVAGGRIEMQAQTLALIRSGSAKKGDVLGIARIAAIQAATFNLVGAGNLVLQGGTITVANPSTINILGQCIGCDTNLLPRDQYTVTAGVLPPADFGFQVATEILALSDLSLGLYETVLDADGNLYVSRRRLNQCY